METKKRDTNFELLRIISMIFIVTIHYVSHTEILNTVTVGSFNYYLVEILKVATRASVNLYVLISGYYLINSKIKIRKLVCTWIMVIFYSILFLPVPYLIAGQTEVKFLINTFLPINSASYWFATVYIVLYMLSPFLNIWLKNLNKKQYKLLLIILGIPLVVTRTVFSKNVVIDAMGGVSLIFFIYLYMIAGYIRLHYNKKVNKGKCIVIALVSISINCAINLIETGIFNYMDDRCMKYSNLFTVIASIYIFIYFKEIKIKNEACNKVITTISPLTFGIYLIHENVLLKMFIWRIVINAPAYAKSPYLIIHIIVCTIAVFGNCAVIEFVRQKLFKLLRKTKLSKKLDRRLERINMKFWSVMDGEKG